MQQARLRHISCRRPFSIGAVIQDMKADLLTAIDATKTPTEHEPDQANARPSLPEVAEKDQQCTGLIKCSPRAASLALPRAKAKAIRPLKGSRFRFADGAAPVSMPGSGSYLDGRLMGLCSCA